MALTRPIAAIALVGLVVTAHFALMKQSEWNGTFSFESLLTYNNRLLPVEGKLSSVPIKLPSTGSQVADNYFAFMLSFFWAALDARNVRAHWAANHLLGTLSSIWLIMTLEAHSAKGWALVAITYVFEFMGELLGIGLWTPIWCLVHLLIAPKKRSAISRASLRSLGWGLLLGHVVPTVLMLRTKIDGEGLRSQQIWTIGRLFHPLFVFTVWSTLRSLQGTSGPASSAGSRRVYTFAILASGFFHVSSLAYLLAPEMFPGWVKPEVASALDIKSNLVPVPFWSESVVKTVDFKTGVAIFLQWDYLCSSAAIVVWATALYFEAAANKVNKVAQSSLETLGQTLLVAVLAGPAAAAAFLLQERDGLLTTGTDDEKKKQ